MSSSRPVRRSAATHKDVRSAVTSNQSRSAATAPKRTQAGPPAAHQLRSATIRNHVASSPTPKDPRASLCTFTFADNRRCSSPRASGSPLCLYHARKEAQSSAAEKLSSEISYYFSGDFLTAGDLATSLGRLIPAVLRGDVKPKTARIVAYLAQTLAQTLQLTQREFADSFGSTAWRDAVRSNLRQNFQYRNPPKPAPPQPVAPAPGDTSIPPTFSATSEPAHPRRSGEIAETQPSPEVRAQAEMDAEIEAETGIATESDPETESEPTTGPAHRLSANPATPLESALVTPPRNC